MLEPIKVQAYDKAPYKFVEWKLHDKCNYDCSFCGDENKKGLVGWQDYNSNLATIDAIAKACDGHPYWIQITGGEPTLYPRFLDLLAYMKSKGAMIRLISNGSRTIRWWTLLRDSHLVDYILFTYHSEQKASYTHLADVTNLFHDEPTVTVNLVTYVPHSVELALEGAEYLIEHTGSYISTNAMDLVDTHIDETTISSEVFEKIKEYSLAYGKRMDSKMPSGIPKELMQPIEAVITYNDGSTVSKDVTLMMKIGENQFEGWECDAGLDSLNIEGNMKFRGGCKRDPTPFATDQFGFFDKPFKCDVRDCWCATDMVTAKRKYQA